MHGHRHLALAERWVHPLVDFHDFHAHDKNHRLFVCGRRLGEARQKHVRVYIFLRAMVPAGVLGTRTEWFVQMYSNFLISANTEKNEPG